MNATPRSVVSTPPTRLSPTAWGIALLMFAVFYGLYSHNNRFPYLYENDAPSKVDQVITGTRNFRHPALMLNVARLVGHSAATAEDRQGVVIAGRRTSALFSALGIAGLALLGWQLGGPPGAMVASALAGLNPQLVTLSHAFKEDATLVGCLALVLLGVKLVWDALSLPRVAFLGAATGLALSAKYIGALSLAPALLALGLALRSPAAKGRRSAFLVAFFLSLIATAAVSNYQAVIDPSRMFGGFGAEMTAVNEDKFTEQIPRWDKATDNVVDHVHWSILAFFLIELVASVIRRPRDAARLILLGFPIVYWILLAFSPHQFSRYYLPVIIFVTFGAGLGVVTTGRALAALTRGKVPAPILAGALGALAVGMALGPALAAARDFAKDHRRAMAEWMMEHLPPDAVVAQDERVFLSGRGEEDGFNSIPQHVVSMRRLTEIASEDQLEALGIDYLATANLSSRKWLQSKKPAKNFAPSFLGDYVAERGTIVWEVDGGDPGYLAPGLKVIRLDRPGSLPKPEPVDPGS